MVKITYGITAHAATKPYTFVAIHEDYDESKPVVGFLLRIGRLFYQAIGETDVEFATYVLAMCGMGIGFLGTIGILIRWAIKVL